MVQQKNIKTVIFLAPFFVIAAILLLPVGMASAEPKSSGELSLPISNEEQLPLSDSTSYDVQSSDEECKKWKDHASKAEKTPQGLAKKITA